MTTESQAAALFEPFLRQHPEFVRLGRVIYLAPVRHVVAGFKIDRAAYKGSVRPSWFVGPSFGLPPSYGGGVGRMLDQAVGYLDQPDIAERLIEAMELAHSGILMRARSLDDLLELQWKARPHLGMRRCDEGLILAALGRLEDAEERFQDDLRYRRTARMPINALHPEGSKGFERERIARAQYDVLLQNLAHAGDLAARRDKKALAALLHQWQAEFMAKLKIQRLWEPQPFPIELGAER